MKTNGVAAGGAAARAAPTGCFKCGRPGHWSRDCPSSTATASSAPETNASFSSSLSPKFSKSTSSWKSPAAAKTSAPAKRAPATRPKLTPDLLLSEDGLGYVLRHFPRAFKYHGRGREVSDLGNLIGMYAQWHSRLIPYYSFDQFVHKVEQLGGNKRVRRCVSELRNRVAMGGDPTKLHEPPVEQAEPEDEPEGANDEALTVDGNGLHLPLESQDGDDIHDTMFDEIYHEATEEPCESLKQGPNQVRVSPTASISNAAHTQAGESTVSVPANTQITEEQRARMESNRLKALERAAARARQSQTS